jgi:hypothetical protein
MNRAVLVVLETLLSAAAGASAAGQTEAPLIVAYISSDGELVPVARFDGTNWRNTWPEPIPEDVPLPVRELGEIPQAWLGQSVPLTWTTWSGATGRQHRVRITGVDRDGSCVQAITLTTSPAAAPADGLAFNRPTAVTAIIELNESSPESNRLRREVVPHFKTAIRRPEIQSSGGERRETGNQVLTLARVEDDLADEHVVMQKVFRDPASSVFFIEASRQYPQIPSDTQDDAVSYRGWFRREGGRAGRLIPITASVTTFSTAEGKLPRYTPIGILRLRAGAIWVMAQWGIESLTIVLLEISDRGVRTLTSADISGC